MSTSLRKERIVSGTSVWAGGISHFWPENEKYRKVLHCKRQTSPYNHWSICINLIYQRGDI